MKSKAVLLSPRCASSNANIARQLAAKTQLRPHRAFVAPPKMLNPPMFNHKSTLFAIFDRVINQIVLLSFAGEPISIEELARLKKGRARENNATAIISTETMKGERLTALD